MQLITEVELPQNRSFVSHEDQILMLGSCFAESIGNQLLKNKFHCDVNPFGILYNPLSVAEALKQILSGRQYTEDDLFCYQERYHSYMHHGSFSASGASDTLNAINTRLQKAHQSVKSLNHLMITWGTSWIYTLKDTGMVVSNCHKMSASTFVRRKLDVEEIVTVYTELLHSLFQENPTLAVVFTLSPIRHSKDGLHGNQLSKATLLLAIDKLTAVFPRQVTYFPSYEIVLDELRDYRFYADDMCHPSPLAIEYIWERFARTFFNSETQNIIKEYESIHKALSHRPFDVASAQYKRFLQQIVLKIEQLKRKYPKLELQKELDSCHTLLNTLPN